MQIKNLLFSLLFAPLAACGNAATDQNAAMLNGPPVTTIESPFTAGLACLRNALSPEQRQSIFAVGEMKDSTGRFNISSENGVGQFSTQGAEYALVNALRKTGVRVADSSLPVRGLMEWYGKMADAKLVGDGQRREMGKPGSGQLVNYIPRFQGTIMQPEFLVVGAINGLDFLPGGGAELSINGIGAGYRQNRVFVNIDAHTTRMPFGNQVGGEVVADGSINKQVVGDETKAGITHFFGPTFVSFNIGAQRREALQYVELQMMNYVAFLQVSNTFGIRSCDNLLPVLHEAAPPPPVTASVEPAAKS